MANLETTVALLQLIDVLKKLTERVGVPVATDKNNPLIVSPSDDAERAKIWGETLEIGKFSKPTSSNTNNIVSVINPAQPTTPPLTNNPFGILGINSKQLVELSTDLGLAIPGLLAFKNLDWELLAVATEYLDDFLLDLNLMEDDIIKAAAVTDMLKTVSFGLSQIGIFGAAATVAGWTILAGAMIPIGAVMAALAFIAPFAPAINVGLLTVETVLSALLLDAALGIVLIAGLGLALIPLAYGLSKLAEIEWETLGKAGVVLGSLIAVVVGLGVPAVSALAGLGIAVMLGLAGGLAVLGLAFSYISTLNVDKLPEIGTNIGLFLTNLVSGVGVITAAKLTAFGPILLAVSGGIAALGLSINSLMPNTDKFIGFINNFVNFDTSKVVTVSEQLTTSFDNVSRSIQNIGEAIDQVSFTKLALLATNLGKVAVSVNAFSPEMIKTNAILGEQLLIQKQQLVELQTHSNLLKNLKVGTSSTGSSSMPPTQNNTSTFNTTWENFRSSAYYTK
jgi:hypothetical protein